MWAKFPDTYQEIPCSVAQGFLLQLIETSDQLGAEITAASPNQQNSQFFSLLSENLHWRLVRI
jgi:hypothetical protein